MIELDGYDMVVTDCRATWEHEYGTGLSINALMGANYKLAKCDVDTIVLTTPSGIGLTKDVCLNLLKHYRAFASGYFKCFHKMRE